MYVLCTMYDLNIIISGVVVGFIACTIVQCTSKQAFKEKPIFIK